MTKGTRASGGPFGIRSGWGVAGVRGTAGRRAFPAGFSAHCISEAANARRRPTLGRSQRVDRSRPAAPSGRVPDVAAGLDRVLVGQARRLSAKPGGEARRPKRSSNSPTFLATAFAREGSCDNPRGAEAGDIRQRKRDGSRTLDFVAIKFRPQKIFGRVADWDDVEAAAICAEVAPILKIVEAAQAKLGKITQAA